MIIFLTSNLSFMTYWIFFIFLIFFFILGPLFQKQHQMKDKGEKCPRYIESFFQCPTGYSTLFFGVSSNAASLLSLQKTLALAKVVSLLSLEVTLVLVERESYTFKSELKIW
jgi:hypothetical protein